MTGNEVGLPDSSKAEAPYYQDDLVTLYHGDCREISAWLDADVLITDPPYGRGWTQSDPNTRRGWVSSKHDGIANDADPSVRDEVLEMWAAKPGVVFGHLLVPPSGVRQVLIYGKASNAGSFGTFGGFRRDAEAVYLTGKWTAGTGGRSSIIQTRAATTKLLGERGHPHGKPLDVVSVLIQHSPAGVIADPFAGSGTTLVACKQFGRRAIGVEIDERYCEVAARRLAQDVLDFGAAS